MASSSPPLGQSFSRLTRGVTLEPGPRQSPPVSLPPTHSPASLNACCTLTGTRAFCVQRSGFSRKRGGQSSGLRMFTRERSCNQQAGKGGAEAGREEGADSLPAAGKTKGPSELYVTVEGTSLQLRQCPTGRPALPAPGMANPSSKAVCESADVHLTLCLCPELSLQCPSEFPPIPQVSMPFPLGLSKFSNVVGLPTKANAPLP